MSGIMGNLELERTAKTGRCINDRPVEFKQVVVAAS